MNRWMALARDEAVRGMEADEGGPFGAVIVQDGEIVSRAHNAVLATNDPTAHAEINAIREAARKLGTFDLSGCVLYTTSYPCPMCLGAILWARIPTVYYGASMEEAARGGFDDAHFYETFAHPERVLDLHPLDADGGRELFERWLAKEDRTLY